jgi:hypothetical protein
MHEQVDFLISIKHKPFQNPCNLGQKMDDLPNAFFWWVIDTLFSDWQFQLYQWLTGFEEISKQANILGYNSTKK